MNYITFSSQQIEQNLCSQLANIRLSRNQTQRQLAEEAGISLRTLRRLENGEGTSLDNFLRVLIALRLQHVLEHVLPDPTIRPMERLEGRKKLRQRARPKSGLSSEEAHAPTSASKTEDHFSEGEAPGNQAWRWGDEG